MSQCRQVMLTSHAHDLMTRCRQAPSPLVPAYPFMHCIAHSRSHTKTDYLGLPSQECRQAAHFDFIGGWPGRRYAVSGSLPQMMPASARQGHSETSKHKVGGQAR